MSALPHEECPLDRQVSAETSSFSEEGSRDEGFGFLSPLPLSSSPLPPVTDEDIPELDVKEEGSHNSSLLVLDDPAELAESWDTTHTPDNEASPLSQRAWLPPESYLELSSDTSLQGESNYLTSPISVIFSPSSVSAPVIPRRWTVRFPSPSSDALSDFVPPRRSGEFTHSSRPSSTSTSRSSSIRWPTPSPVGSPVIPPRYPPSASPRISPTSSRKNTHSSIHILTPGSAIYTESLEDALPSRSRVSTPRRRIHELQSKESMLSDSEQKLPRQTARKDAQDIINAHAENAQPSDPPADASTTNPTPPEPRTDMWSMYLAQTLKDDREMVAAWNADLDSLLMFAALFSAVVTTFVVESSSHLQQDDSTELLRAILLEMRASGNSTRISSTPVPPGFEVDGSAVRVNLYWFSSLVIALAAALIDILAKQWVNYLLAGLSAVSSTGARHRQYRIDGMHKWKLPTVISMLPVLLHVSVLLFFAGLVEFIWPMNLLVAGVTAVLVILISTVYLAANTLAYIYPECPYKTSVAVFIGELLNFAAMAYRRVSVTVQVVYDYLKSVRALADAQSENVLKKLKAQKYESLRVLSLRQHEEVLVAQNASLIDARILKWLLLHKGLSDTQSLGRILTDFPDLLLHQDLLIEEESYALLEQSFSSSYTASFASLDAPRQHDVSTIVRTLASLESEVGSASGTSPLSLRKRRSLSFSLHRDNSVASNPITTSRLSHSSMILVRRLLAELPTLPLPLMASALRLGIRLLYTSENDRDWVMVARGTTLLLRRLLESHPPLSDSQDLFHVVNSILYVALHDDAYPHWRIMYPAGALNWLTLLPDLIVDAQMDAAARRQLSWGISVLAQYHIPECPPREGRGSLWILTTHDVSALLVSMGKCLTHGSDSDTEDTSRREAMYAILIAMDHTLRDYMGGLYDILDNTNRAREALTSLQETRAIYVHFLTQLHEKLRRGRCSEEVTLPILVPLTRIALWLSSIELYGEEPIHTTLLVTVLSIFRILVASQSLSPNRSRPQQFTHGVGPSTLDRRTIHQWIYRATCTIIRFYLDVAIQVHDPDVGTIAPPVRPELLFTEITSEAAVAADFVSALEHINRHEIIHHAPASTQTSSMLGSFSAVMKDIFTRNIQLEAGLRGAGGWDYNATRIVASFMQQGGLNTLVESTYPHVHTALFAPAINVLHAIFFARAHPPDGRLFGPAAPSDRQHPANEIASALINPFTQFLVQFEETVRRGSFRDIARQGLLDKVISIAGYLALYENPARRANLDAVLTMLSFSRALLSTYMKPEAQAAPGPHSDHSESEHEMFLPETIAAGLIRILAVSAGCATFTQTDRHAHCNICAPTHGELNSMKLTLRGTKGWESRSALWAMTKATLWTIHTIWGGHDRKFRSLRQYLIKHGLASRVQYLQQWRGEIGLLANSMAYRIGGTARSVRLLEYPTHSESLDAVPF